MVYSNPMSATIKIEVDEETAKKFLSDIQDDIKKTLQSKEVLESRLATLEARAKNIRSQMNGGSENGRQPQGVNSSLISEYLKGLIGKGASPSTISTATGVKLPSVYYTLQHNPDKFMADTEAGVWKLKSQ